MTAEQGTSGSLGQLLLAWTKRAFLRTLRLPSRARGRRLFIITKC